MRETASLIDYTQDVRRIPTGLPFDNGDEMDQPTFHALYETCPDGFRAELIEGIVCFKMSTSIKHGRPHNVMTIWVSQYVEATPGTESFPPITLILDMASEPEPDVVLILDKDSGGQTSESEDGYLVGPPELVVEIANTTTTTDLGRKKRDYERAGVKEYIVVLPTTHSIIWFHRLRDRFVDLDRGW